MGKYFLSLAPMFFCLFVVTCELYSNRTVAQDIPSGTMKPLTVVSQNVSSDGYPYYEIDGNILLWDVRDDPTAPAVTSGDVIYGYLLFDGIQSVDNTPYPSFFLISLEQAF